MGEEMYTRISCSGLLFPVPSFSSLFLSSLLTFSFAHLFSLLTFFTLKEWTKLARYLASIEKASLGVQVTLPED